MRNWAILIGGLGALATFVAVALYLTGMAMPGVLDVVVEKDLPAPPDAVQPLLIGADGFGRWLPGSTAAGGPPSGVGARIALDHALGDALTVTLAQPLAVEYDVERGRTVVHASLGLFATADGTRLQWFETRDLGTPYQRWWARMTGAEDHSAEAINDALGALQQTLGRGR